MGLHLRKLGTTGRVPKITASALPAGVSAQVPMAPDVALPCRRPPGGGRPGPGRGWPRAGHSLPEAPLHFAGFACPISVLSRHRSSVGLRWPSERIAALHRLPIRSVLVGIGVLVYWCISCAMRLALRSDGGAQPATSDR